MLALQSSRKPAASDSFADYCTPNVLPCKVHHDGPVELSQRYWKPVNDEKGENKAIMISSLFINTDSAEQTTIAPLISEAAS
jgi:hypothetical protein